MSTHKDKAHLEYIRDEIEKTQFLSEDEKSLTMRKIDQWILEDRASGTFYEELVELAVGIKPMLAELGLI